MANESAGLYYTEQHSPALRFSYKVKKVIFSGKTEYQKVDIVDLEAYGKTLFLDQKIQSALVDEYIFHESLVHPALFTHPLPKKVLIIGGGEGATLREVLKHGTVEEVTMVDIDGELVELCKTHLPEWHRGAFEDPRSHILYGDARQFLFEREETFDVIVSDLTEPLEEGPSQLLFTKEFYTKVWERLSEDGIIAIQSASGDPVYADFVASLVKTLEGIFPIVRVCWAFTWSFSMPWTFTIASKRYDPIHLSEEGVGERMASRAISGLRYYSPEIHRAMFVLPPYLKEILKKGRFLTDKDPYIYPE